MAANTNLFHISPGNFRIRRKADLICVDQSNDGLWPEADVALKRSGIYRPAIRESCLGILLAMLFSRIKPVWRGALVAVISPFPLSALISSLIDKRPATPSLHTFAYPPNQLIIDIGLLLVVIVVGLIVTAPAVGIWLLLRKFNWARWYICVALGILTGSIGVRLLNASPETSAQIAFSLAGGVVGAVVWSVARDQEKVNG